MKMWFAIAGALMLLATHADANAQDRSSRFEGSVGISHWILDGGTASSNGHSRTGAELEAGVKMGKGFAIQFNAGWAPEGDPDPGLSFVGLGIRSSLLNSPDHPFLKFGGGYAWVDADRMETIQDECVPEVGCMFESVGYTSGSAPYLSGSLGFSMRIAAGFALEPELSLLYLAGGDGGPRNHGAFLGAGVAVAWRP